MVSAHLDAVVLKTGGDIPDAACVESLLPEQSPQQAGLPKRHAPEPFALGPPFVPSKSTIKRPIPFSPPIPSQPIAVILYPCIGTPLYHPCPNVAYASASPGGSPVPLSVFGVLARKHAQFNPGPLTRARSRRPWESSKDTTASTRLPQPPALVTPPATPYPT